MGEILCAHDFSQKSAFCTSLSTKTVRKTELLKQVSHNYAQYLLKTLKAHFLLTLVQIKLLHVATFI